MIKRHQMRLRIAWLMASTIASPLVAFGQEQAQPEATFRADVANVKLDAQVLVKDKVVKNLTKEDFVLMDEGRPQPILSFGTDTVPLDLVLLLDNSGSVHQWLKEIAGIARFALQKLQPNDRVSVVIFGRTAKTLQEFTSDAVVVQRAIERAATEPQVGSGTRIFSSILDALRTFDSHQQPPGPVRRRAMLVLTDNISISFRVPKQGVVKALYDEDVTFNAIVVGRHPHPVEPAPGSNSDFTPDDVFPLASETGGEAIAAKKPDEQFSNLLEHIRDRYSMSFRAGENSSAPFHRISLTLSKAASRKHKNATIKTRGGYYVNR